jgi:hypothetical protein
MTLPKLDQTKPPPGFLPGQCGGYYQPCCGYNKDAAWDEYHKRSAPAIDDALARLVEWLRDKARGKDGTVIHTVDASYDVRVADALADAIESGDWRND